MKIKKRLSREYRAVASRLNGAEITRGCDQWQVFDVVKVEEDRSNGHPYRGQFATGLDVRDLREAEQIGTWGRRRRNMTRKKWVQIIREALMRKGIELGLESVPRRCISREFMMQ